MRELSIQSIRYGGEYSAFFWSELNPNATIENGLANCTTFVYGDCLIDGFKPVSIIKSASDWHTVFNGEILSYKPENVRVGDIIEWKRKCHVARVFKIENGKIYVRGSFYTGMHGKSIYEGEYDTRNFSSLKEMSDWFVNNYPYRFYHEADIEKESLWVGGTPDYILRCPTILPDGEDKSKNQIQVLTNEQNVRKEPYLNAQVVGKAQSGFYNVLSAVNNDGYDWYEIGENKFIAGVNGRVVYIDKSLDYETLYKQVETENKELRSRLKKIGVLADYD